MHYPNTFRIEASSAPRVNSARGFTLIELMIVVAIIGILAAIALPSYNESVKASRRADAQRALGEAEQFMRRYYSAQDTYVGATLSTTLSTSPREGSAAYNISLSDLDVSTFTITATRTGDLMNGDRCGDLSIDQTSAKTISNQTGSLTLADCFKGS